MKIETEETFLSPQERELQRLEHLASLLDDRFVLPGTSVRIGLDGILGLVPVIGDFASLLPTLYVVIRAHRLGAPGHLILRMLFNAFLDWAIGSIPVLGDIFDIAFKANKMNVGLLQNYLRGQNQ